MSPEPAHVSDDQLAEHAAGVDSALEDILADVDSELELAPAEEPEAEEASEEEPEEVVAEAAEEELEEEAEAEDAEAEEEENADPGFDSEQRHQAWLALKRDGWSEGEIDALPEQTMVARGLHRISAQKENDTTYRERDTLRSQLGQSKPTESAEGQSGATDPAQDAGGSDPKTTGADLTSAALPVARALAEMDDPEKVAQELVSFTQKAVQASTGQQAEAIKSLEARVASYDEVTMPELIRQRLGPDFEGDLKELLPEAAKLGIAGLHSDKVGLDRAVALVHDVQKLRGKAPKARSKSSTSRARRRGAAPPISGRKTPTKARTRDEIIDDRLRRILVDGVRDTDKL